MDQLTSTNETLNELREGLTITNPSPMQRMRIAELFTMLDSELSNGGRFPDDWADGIRPLTGRGKHACQICGKLHYLPMCRITDDEDNSQV